MKRCACCLKEKPTNKFSKNKRTKDGLCAYCLKCNREKNKIYYFNKYGSTHPLKRNKNLPPKERFKRSYKKNGNGCWIWLGKSLANYGYGAFKVRGEKYMAHRYSWILHNGEIPKGLFVLHKCDVPQCVNPEHLFLGTAKDNVKDMIKKGRGNYTGPKNPQRGEKRPLSKLREKDVLNIRKDKRPQRKIAEDYGVSQCTIHKLKARKTWGHL